VFPEDDRMIETCRSVLSVLMQILRLLKTIYVHLLVCYLNKLQNALCNDRDNTIPLFTAPKMPVLCGNRYIQDDKRNKTLREGAGVTNF